MSSIYTSSTDYDALADYVFSNDVSRCLTLQELTTIMDGKSLSSITKIGNPPAVANRFIKYAYNDKEKCCWFTERYNAANDTSHNKMIADVGSISLA